jgi:hypothetical protein
VHPQVRRQLRVERRAQEPPRAHRDRLPVQFGKGLDALAQASYNGGADEHGMERRVQSPDRDVRLERVHLRAEGVAPHRDVEHAERPLLPTFDLVRQEDQAHARAPGRHAVCDALADLFVKPVSSEQNRQCRALAAWNDEAGTATEVLGGANLLPLHAKARQGLQVLLEIALKGENADRFRHGAELYPLAESLPNDAETRSQRKEGRRLGDWSGANLHVRCCVYAAVPVGNHSQCRVITALPRRHLGNQILMEWLFDKIGCSHAQQMPQMAQCEAGETTGLLLGQQHTEAK